MDTAWSRLTWQWYAVAQPDDSLVRVSRVRFSGCPSCLTLPLHDYAGFGAGTMSHA